MSLKIKYEITFKTIICNVIRKKKWNHNILYVMWIIKKLNLKWNKKKSFETEWN